MQGKRRLGFGFVLAVVLSLVGLAAACGDGQESRYTATYDAEKAARAHAAFGPADHLEARLAGRKDEAPVDDLAPLRRTQA